MNVGELRDLLAELRDETEVRVHEGWDWPICETDVDDGKLILFADTPETHSLVDLQYVCARFGGEATCPAPDPGTPT